MDKGRAIQITLHLNVGQQNIGATQMITKHWCYTDDNKTLVPHR